MRERPSSCLSTAQSLTSSTPSSPPLRTLHPFVAPVTSAPRTHSPYHAYELYAPMLLYCSTTFHALDAPHFVLLPSIETPPHLFVLASHTSFVALAHAFPESLRYTPRTLLSPLTSCSSLRIHGSLVLVHFLCFVLVALVHSSICAIDVFCTSAQQTTPRNIRFCLRNLDHRLYNLYRLNGRQQNTKRWTENTKRSSRTESIRRRALARMAPLITVQRCLAIHRKSSILSKLS